MGRVKSLEESDIHRVEDSYRRAYLQGKQSLKWMIGIIRSSSLRGTLLLEVLDRIDTYSDPDEMRKRRSEQLRTELVHLKFVS